MKFHPDILAAHAEFGGDLEDMQRKYDEAGVHSMTHSSEFSVEGTASVKDGELAPCPFCGSTAFIARTMYGYGHLAVCDDCGASLQSDVEPPLNSAEDVRELWNRRAAAPSRDQVSMGALEFDNWRPIRNAIEAAFAQIGETVPENIPSRDWNLAGASIVLFEKQNAGTCIECKRSLYQRLTIRCLDCKQALCEECAPRHFWPNGRGSESASLVPTAEQGVVPEVIGYEVLGAGKIRTEAWADAAQYHPIGAVSVDNRDVIVYRSRADGGIWVIPREEFDESGLSALTPPIAGAGEEAVATAVVTYQSPGQNGMTIHPREWWHNLPIGSHPLYSAASISHLYSRIGKLERERIVAPAECSPTCDDPDCPYSHQPLTLRTAYENSVARMRNAEARAEAAEAELAEARDVLEWYGENARLARLIHSEGDAGRAALANDGGRRARSFHSPKEPGPADSAALSGGQP